jgi:hypothetical protein
MSQLLQVPTTVTQTTPLLQELTYDGLNRLKTAEETNGWSQTYVYGRYGNRAVLDTSYLPAGSLTPQVNSDSGTAVETIFPNNRISTGIYDDAGNLLAHGADGLSYDAENRQKERSKLYSGVTYSTEYSYDGEGRRVKKVEKVNGSETASTVFVYDAGGQLAAEYGGSVASDPLDCQRCFLTADHLGSTRMVTKEDGSGERGMGFVVAEGVAMRGAGQLGSSGPARGVSLLRPQAAALPGASVQNTCCPTNIIAERVMPTMLTGLYGTISALRLTGGPVTQRGCGLGVTRHRGLRRSSAYRGL